ncbi:MULTISPECIES: TRAP transporter large permease subunit [unclassified Saccharopolyspora]|uniref:TRAP transporter large permease subunit n=1 Tax=unclassified Saccharopolyspora TaxID=2646250 RepID=UPI001CD1C765|nr:MULTISPECIES: TRAP transporter large permease subunit [unclassified Saccharopolyspora]MCA1185335.1 TRAP transporter permease [Saccharopolyspora sp. 6T]MCA1194254.1 TRAP transporter permease [Saccharopolyspora sp. 6V]MCA1279398.1 TRAP transporter permease [Saccharopolyspora sp. 7B]
MGVAVWALITYIAIIVVWNTVLKRNIGEAMLVGFVAVCLFGGGDALELARAGLDEALSEEVVFAALAFVFMGYLMTELGLIDRQVTLLNSVFGRLRGGSAYVSTSAAALLGGPAGSGSGIAASVGSVTIPWMIRSRWRPDLAASLVAGNAGLGISIPPSSSMFLLLGSAAVAPVLSADQLIVAAFAGGLWTVLYRFVVVFSWVRRFRIEKISGEDIAPLRIALQQGFGSLLVYAGIAIPVVLTLDVGVRFLESRVGDAADDISVIVWIPVLTILATLLVAWRRLPRTGREWSMYLGNMASRYAVIGATLLFAFAAAASLGELGLVAQLTAIMEGFEAPLWIVASVVGLLLVVIAAPLTGTATIAAVGGVAFSALTAAGAPPAAAATAILIFASTEGASPPGAAPIYIATGIAGVDPSRTFLRLILWFVLPILAIGVLVATGLLPVPA